MRDDPGVTLLQSGDEADIDAQSQIDEIVRQGPAGAFAVAGIATAIVLAMYFVFYISVYLPRGAVQ